MAALLLMFVRDNIGTNLKVYRQRLDNYSVIYAYYQIQCINEKKNEIRIYQKKRIVHKKVKVQIKCLAQCN